MKNKLYDILFDIGKFSGCHQLAERSFFIKGRQFPVCARCFGAFLGSALALSAFWFTDIHICISLLLCAPLAVDWYLQEYRNIPSTNLRRLITGLLCGYGFNYLYLKALVKLFKLFLYPLLQQCCIF